MKVAPSFLSANFATLQTEVEMINSSAADYIHLDIMDGVFVPNISFGFPIMETISKLTTIPLDVHLMIIEPHKWIGRIRDVGAEIMNVHLEACQHLHRTVSAIHEAGMKAGVTLNPSTPVSLLVDIINDVDLVLLMSVNPGFGGQTFIPHTLKKVEELKKLIIESGSKALIEVDGGVNEKTGKLLSEAGTDILVAGNYIFKCEDPHNRINILKGL